MYVVQCATFSKSLNHQNIEKSVSDIRIRIRFLFEGSFWISVSGCKLTILPDIQPANRIVIISARQWAENSCFSFGNTALQPARPTGPPFTVIQLNVRLVRKFKKHKTIRLVKYKNQENLKNQA